VSDERILYLPEPEGTEVLWRMFSKKADHSYLLWTDDYLAAFALQNEARLITLDRAMKERYPSVEILVVG